VGSPVLVAWWALSVLVTPTSGWLVSSPVVLRPLARKSPAAAAVLRRPLLARARAPPFAARARCAASPAGETGHPEGIDAELAQKNCAVHAKECENMRQTFDPALPAGKSRHEYGPDDFVSLSVGDTLIGENKNGKGCRRSNSVSSLLCMLFHSSSI